MAREVSPRLSFSHSPTFSDSTLRADHALPVDPPSAEFDFSSSSSSFSRVDSSTPADLLFSHGKLLPLYHNPTVDHRSSTTPPRIPKPNHKTPDRVGPKKLEDKIGRSCSVSNSNTRTDSSACPFPRSRSTGYTPQQNLRPSKSRKQDARSSTRFSKSPSESSSKTYYYSGDRTVSSACGPGVRINGVINLTVPRGGSSGSSSSNNSGGGGITTSGGGRSSFFAYLLCNCRDKKMEMDEMEGGFL